MEQNEKATFTRQQLYDLVWAEPLLSLSRKYNISDNGLRKICTNMGVPTPVAGYWAKIQHGQSPPVKPLPPPSHYDQKEATLYFRDENHPAMVDGLTPVAAMQQVIERDHAAELKVNGYRERTGVLPWPRSRKNRPALFGVPTRQYLLRKSQNGPYCPGI